VSGFLSLDSRVLLEGPLAELLSLRGFDEAAVTSADAATKASSFVLDGGREGIEAARSIREVYGSEVIFVTSSTDRHTLDQIHQTSSGSAGPAKAGQSPTSRRGCGRCALGLLRQRDS
jgi:hypothetical protein